MEFQTKMSIPPSQTPIDYHSKILLMGSCFSDHMATKFEQAQFQCLANPFGVVFHPMALASLFKRAAAQEFFVVSDLFFSQDAWHSFYFHSSLSHPSKEEVLKKANQALGLLYEFLTSATHIYVTLGTAWGYILKKNPDFWVANCHKQSASIFDKKLASPLEIAAALDQIQGSINFLNPNAQLFFTVSPVRHLKDGFVENNRSKAQLIQGVHTHIENVNTALSVHSLESKAAAKKDTKSKKKRTMGQTLYFPAYEIQMDELRDYRFYAADMLHPSPLAVQYIWERFKDYALARHALHTLEQVEKIQRGLDHIPFKPQATAHLAFIVSLQSQISSLQKEYPWMFRE
jgi:hypothetical protein